jgi:signal transduction histidine kinase
MSGTGSGIEKGRAAGFFALGGEMAARTEAFDWSRTPIGPLERWPESLKTAVRLVMGSRYPMFVWWGPSMINLYNDAYIPVLGNRHPDALGRPASEIWTEIWETIGPQTRIVLNEGRATWNENLLLVMERNGYSEETYFTFSYSPIADENGIGGLFCACMEETGRVVGERRLRTLRDVAARTAEAKTAEEVCRRSAAVLAENAYDLPFVLLYLVDGRGERARLVAAAGLEPGGEAAPSTVEIAPVPSESNGWPLAPVAASGKSVVMAPLSKRFGRFPGGPWPQSPDSAVVLPIIQHGQPAPTGFLIAGLSPKRPFDDDYRSFVELVAGQVSTAVSSARAYEDERRRSEMLAELDRAKTAFFTNVSHEFRTPLTLILGPLEAALGRGADALPPEHREQLTVAHRNGLRLLKLVNTLLDFSRIEADRVQAVYEPTDLAQFTADLAGVFRSPIEQAGLRLTVDCRPLPEPVYVDRDLWEKIVLNLLSNAFKFTFTGDIVCALHGSGKHVELTVRDTGIGIPEAELPHMFERFHRVQGARGRTYEGTGIGLALVKELVRLHGGGISVSSVEGQGSIFTVTIPTGTAHLPADRIRHAEPRSSPAVVAAAYVEEALRWLPDSRD